MREYIQAAKGARKADILLKNGQLVNVISGEIYPANVLIYKDRVVGIHKPGEGHSEAEEVIELNGKYICPSFIDSHIHIESSLLHPVEFSKAAVLHGTGAVIADPHEMANVLGAKGIKYMLEASSNLPLDFYFMLPSCVPSSELETSGAKLEASDLRSLMKKERVLGLAEVMNYPAVIEGHTDILDKIELAKNKSIDGHAPRLSGNDLQAYVSAGIYSEHECVSLEEAKDKLRLGMRIKIREGSAARDLEALLPLIDPHNSQFLSFCTDDLDPKDLSQGHIDLLVKKAIALGGDQMMVLQMASIFPCLQYGIKNRGAVVPGYFADILILDDLHDIEVNMVIKYGKKVVERGKLVQAPKIKRKAVVKETVNFKPLEIKDLKIKASEKFIRVIEIVPGQIITNSLLAEANLEKNEAIPEVEKDILKLIVVERHKASGNIGKGFVKGFGLKSGALASSFAHDAHNIICAGVNDEDMLSAVRRVGKIKGGMVYVSGGMVVAEVPLPVAGLMSEEPLEVLLEQLLKLESALKNAGVSLEHPLAQLSFLALPVIPELKLTDLGLIDVNKFKVVDLFEKKAKA